MACIYKEFSISDAQSQSPQPSDTEIHSIFSSLCHHSVSSTGEVRLNIPFAQEETVKTGKHKELHRTTPWGVASRGVDHTAL